MGEILRQTFQNEIYGKSKNWQSLSCSRSGANGGSSGEVMSYVTKRKKHSKKGNRKMLSLFSRSRTSNMTPTTLSNMRTSGTNSCI